MHNKSKLLYTYVNYSIHLVIIIYINYEISVSAALF